MLFSIRRRISRLPIASALLASAALAAQANAEVVTSNISVHGTTPTTGFTATVTATGSATVSGNGSINLGTIFGASLGTQGFSLSQQTVPINLQGGSINVATSPTGNIVTAYNNTYSGLGVDHLQGGSVNLLNGTNVPINFNPVSFSISTSVIGIPISLGLDLNVNGALTGLVYNATGPSPPLGGTNPAFYVLPGTFDIAGNVSATGSTSILGINVSLGTLLNQSLNQTGVDALSSIGGLPGVATLTNIVTPNPHSNDLGSNFQLPNLGISIPSDISQSGVIDQQGSSSGSLGSLHDLHLNYTINLTLTLSNISYNLTGDVVPGAVVPEASTLVMSGLAAVGLVGAGVRKLRRRKAA